MGAFTLNNNCVKIEILKNTFMVDPMHAKQVQPVIQKKMTELAETNECAQDKSRLLEQALKTVCQCIDMLLGAGATERIFQNRTVSFFDLMDVYFYVQKRVDAFTEEKLAGYKAAIKKGRKKGEMA